VCYSSSINKIIPSDAAFKTFAIASSGIGRIKEAEDLFHFLNPLNYTGERRFPVPTPRLAPLGGTQ
jgi:hypothetical protein